MRQKYVKEKLQSIYEPILASIFTAIEENLSILGEGAAFTARAITPTQNFIENLDERTKRFFYKVMEGVNEGLANDLILPKFFEMVARSTNDPAAGQKMVNGIAAPFIKNLAEEFDRVSKEHNIEPSFVDQLAPAPVVATV